MLRKIRLFLTLEYKADGIITRNEYSSDPNVDLRDVVKVGDRDAGKSPQG